jgi:hypothetical protein
MGIELSRFKAFRKDGHGGFLSITSLLAETFADAREQAERELGKPGRGAYLEAWRADGRLIGRVDVHGKIIGEVFGDTLATHIIVKDTNKLRWAIPDRVFVSNVLLFSEETVEFLTQEKIGFSLAVKRRGEFETV